jgi:hypothetical protein
MTNASNILQQILTSQPILRLPKLNDQFEVQTDASNYGAGAVLKQEHEGEQMPISYFSRRYSKSERNYSVSERKLYAIVLAIPFNCKRSISYKSYKQKQKHRTLNATVVLKYLFVNSNK